MILNLPYLSQHSAATDPFWKPRACAIVCIKTVGDLMRPGSMPSVDDLIHEGQAIGGFDRGPGWRHLHLTILLHNHGVLAYSQEYRSAGNRTTSGVYVPSEYTEEFTNAALTKMIYELKSGRPVIITVPGKSNLPGQVHMMVLTGFEYESDQIAGFYYNNPDTLIEAEGKDCFIKKEDFIKGWRRFAIFVE
ncbi:MAG: C39 family peptidase [Candidatus Vogelbacteria bacterium]|nr:C39 family peptidase [Candidatus Vogelbacteria bacterium]